ncbi:MAG: ABC transporter ATP-binding protein [Betaproteobacteria bacterium]|nr:ABC transporter ATP-binding protein [Betaproteobacteria bacterium]
MNSALLAADCISVRMGERVILNEVSLEVREGEFFSLLGPSGCGKTTLLRIIAGFSQPSSGRLMWQGKDVTRLSPQHRDLNLVFQNYALFPHLNVFENVAFGLRMQKQSEPVVQTRVREALALVRMESHALRRVTELSGGQQQRIALARAIAPRPRMVLLDEPLGALDLQLRKDMQWELKSLQRQLGMTFLYVTHDQEEAFAMSDRIAILSGGNIEQVSTPEILYSRPSTRFVAQFIGTANFIPVDKMSAHKARHLSSGLEFDICTSDERDSAGNFPLKGELLFRPEQLCLRKTASAATCLPVTIQMRQFLGAVVRYHVEIPGSKPGLLTIDHSSVGHDTFAPGESAYVELATANLCFFKEQSRR